MLAADFLIPSVHPILKKEKTSSLAVINFLCQLYNSIYYMQVCMYAPGLEAVTIDQCELSPETDVSATLSPLPGELPLITHSVNPLPRPAQYLAAGGRPLQQERVLCL